MANFCPQCGNEIASNAAFCAACGASAANAAYDNAASSNPYDAGAPIADVDYAAAPSEDPNATVGPTFWGAVDYCLRNYVNFSGRATQNEYWGWCVVTGLIGFVINMIGGVMGTDLFTNLFSLAILAPGWAVSARRLHDVDMSAKWLLASFGLLVAMFGAIWLELNVIALILMAVAGGLGLLLSIRQGIFAGTPGPNRFGPQRLDPDDAPETFDPATSPLIPGFGEAISTCFAKSFTWEGRASRSEYWYFFLFNMIVGGFLVAIGAIAGPVGAFLPYAWMFVAVLPGIAVAARRLHDANHSAIWLLLPFILFPFMVTRSTLGVNQYGPQPAKRA